MNVKKYVPTIYLFVTYLFGLLLFLEWLYPLITIQEQGLFSVFIWYAVLCFIITFLQLRWWMSLLLKGAALGYIVSTYLMPITLFSTEGLTYLLSELSVQLQYVAMQQWGELTDFFRDILFLLLIWVMSYLIYYWFIVVKRIFLFVLLTFTYIAIVDTFTAYDATYAIIRIFILAFIAFGLKTYADEVTRESIALHRLPALYKWLLPLILIVFIATGFGALMPKSEPQWPDPVPFIMNDFDQNKHELTKDSSTIKKVGYGTNDDHLGGSFIQDQELVFQVITEGEQYYRIESKDVYTGKGWERSKDLTYKKQPKDSLEWNLVSNTPTERKVAHIEFGKNFSIDTLIYPYGVQQVEGEGVDHLLVDEDTGVIAPKLIPSQEELRKYTVTYDEPVYALDKLRKASERDPATISDRYTQLPQTIPERVKELAEEITSGLDNRFDKAHAIEKHFSESGFIYDTEDVPVPGEAEDYVDQFLFDSKKGYCDNYSTSMVVLLRSLQIPSRWVKGFTSGELIAENVGENDETNDSLYEVTNANAHSWVEVYFPDVGWVPFEPTKGFSNTSQFTEEEAGEGGLEEEPTEDEVDEEPVEEETAEEESQAEEEKEAEKTEETKDNIQPSVSKPFFIISLFLIAFGLFMLYWYRLKIKTTLLERSFQNSWDKEAFQKSYHHLLQLLEKQGHQMNKGVTLREYSKQVDEHYGTSIMMELTTYYEQLLYNDKMKSDKMNHMLKLWKKMINILQAR